ncbi:hypothetical protein DAPPUDRAFT_51536 [Daphnia pulex]|uniref:chitin synthase n=1 Tax=Daphnia pulex TaxID=6669 RepID=E9GJ42_DAPPU|nr:hypothetical protein DAPPUDRAFT_51536 [Daphnia pulex]|eukprot:EFX80551.1 hypothetical protein DAPPUDRAFT_51536 [Daphnia pulex]
MPTEGSAANTSLKVCIKLIAIFVTFPAVLSAGIVSKGAIFFMTSQIGREMTQLASGGQIQKKNSDYLNVLSMLDSLQHLNGIACWLWTLLFSFTVPELLVFIQSLRICFSRRKLWKRPRLVQFVIAFGLESAQTVGMALLVGSVLPYLSVTHGVLITNCVYLVPAILSFLAREPTKPIMRLMDALSFLTQLSGCLHWIFIRHSLGSNSQMIDWILPVSLILISFGWWENHVYRDAPISFIRYFGQIKEEMTKTRPFAYIIISAWKVVLFFATIFAAAEMTFVAQEAYDGAFDSCSFVIRGGFNQFCYSFMSVEWTSPFYIFIIQATSSFLFYWFGNFACQIGVKSTCFAIPVVLLTPVIMTITSHFEIAKIFDGHFHTQIENQQSFVYLLALSFFWFLSQTWITLHIWSPTAEISDELVSDAKWYNSLLIDQSMNFSPTRHYNKVSESTKCSMMTRVFAVATMWHETSDEMLIILKSIFRMDKDQSRRHLARYCNNMVIDPHCYHYETHIFFDDAFESHSKDGTTSRVVNQFVNQLIELMDKMNCKRTSTCDRKPPVISVTPYGGRLEWTLPGNTKMTVHLKDKSKIRVKKRWSQVMYIDYLIRYEIGNHSDLENTFLLTLDGDMDFRPKAVHILMDVMNSKRDVGIACNRSHPTGSAGPMVWYQMYEYAVGFWLQKPSESVLGDILCAAGCFSLIRATVLLDGDVMSKFVERSEKAHHFIQRDQGEDRWLCTLLIKRGYRLAYSASSYAYTRCPETFDEFYNQRRRWTLSIISNTLDLLWNCRRTVKLHPTISWIFMIFQALSLAIGLLCPGSVFLVLVNTSATTFFIDKWISLLVHSALIFGFIIICFVAPSRIQLRVAKCLSAFYGLIVAAVLIDSVISLAGFNLHGNKMSFSVSNAFFLFLTSCVFLAGCLHPREIHCLLAGPIYLLLTPSMSMLLVLYSVINMNVISWGTRDASVTIGVQSPNKVHSSFSLIR